MKTVQFRLFLPVCPLHALHRLWALSLSLSHFVHVCVCVPEWSYLNMTWGCVSACVSRHTALPWVAVGVADWLWSKNKWKHATKCTRAAIGKQDRKFWIYCLSSTSISLKNTFKCTSVAQLQPTMSDFSMTNHSNYYYIDHEDTNLHMITQTKHFE